MPHVRVASRAMLSFALSMTTNGFAQTTLTRTTVENQTNEGSNPLQVDYHVPNTCTDRSTFLSELEVQRGEPLPREGNLIVEVKPNGTGFVGRAMYRASAQSEHTLTAAGETPWERTIEATTCEEILSVLALAVVVYWDSTSGGTRAGHASHGQSTGNLDARAPSEADASNAPSTAPEVSPPSENASTSGAAPAASASASSQNAEALEDTFWLDEPEPEWVDTAWRLQGLLGGRLWSGITPTPTWSARAVIGLAGRQRGWQGGAYAIAFESTLTSTRGVGIPDAEGDTSWKSYWLAGEAQVCPLGLPVSSRIQLRPCSALHLGQYEARIAREPLHADTFLFADFGLQVQVHAGPLVASLEGGYQTPLDPMRLTLDENNVLRHQGGLGASVSLGLSTEIARRR